MSLLFRYRQQISLKAWRSSRSTSAGHPFRFPAVPTPPSNFLQIVLGRHSSRKRFDDLESRFQSAKGNPTPLSSPPPLLLLRLPLPPRRIPLASKLAVDEAIPSTTSPLTFPPSSPFSPILPIYGRNLRLALPDFTFAFFSLFSTRKWHLAVKLTLFCG